MVGRVALNDVVEVRILDAEQNKLKMWVLLIS